MGNSAVIAWGERQAFSSHKRKAAFHKDQMPPLAFHVAVLFSSGEVSPQPPRWVGGCPPTFQSSPCSTWGCNALPPLLLREAERLGWGLQHSTPVFRGFQCDESPVTGAPEGLGGCPVACDHSWSARGSRFSLYLFKVTKQHKTGNAKPNRKPSWRGNF